MRRIHATIILILALSLDCACQNAAGLYGECDDGFGRYACQQILLDTNGQFEFYDYLHLNGEKVNKGYWSQNGDTITLNSLSQPKIVCKKSARGLDSITLRIVDTTSYFYCGRIYINGDTNALGFLDSNEIKIEYQNIESIVIMLHPNTFVINFSKAELDSSSMVSIYIQRDWSATAIFTNEKWLLEDNNLLYSKSQSGKYDKDRGFKRTRMKNKRF